MQRILFTIWLSMAMSCATVPSPSWLSGPQALESSYLSGYKKSHFYDEQRNKKLKVWLWYPIDETSEWQTLDSIYPWGRMVEDAKIKDPHIKKALIIVSHGFRGRPQEYAWLIEPLVAAGYVVMATEHADSATGLNHWHRSLDISFMLTQFLKSSFGDNIDDSKIGFIGFSMGGLTGLSLAGAKMNKLEAVVPTKSYVNDHSLIDSAKISLTKLDRERSKQDYRDNRIKAEFLMAPAWSWVFNASDLKAISIPILIVAGDSDEILVTKTNGEWYANNIHNAQFRLIKGASHFVFLSTPTCEGKAKFDPKGRVEFLYKDSKGINRIFIQEQVKNLAEAFFKANL